MNGDVFYTWFESVLPKLDRNSVIVMDNAPYHSVKLEKVPTMAWRKDSIIEWLDEKHIPHRNDLLKIELLELVKTKKGLYDGYVIDDCAQKAGHTVLRLPPYHCNLNPIELIWSQVKGYVARHNATFKLPDVRQLLVAGLATVSPDKWKNVINHVIREEEKAWNLDQLNEATVENFIIATGDSDTSDSTSNLEDIYPISDDSDEN
jgi:transposase